MTARKPATPKTTVRKLTTAEAAAEAGAKVPTDHQEPADEAVFVDIPFAGKTWRIDGEDLDDFEFVRAYRDQDPATMAEIILGDQLDDFLAAVKKAQGGKKVPGSEVVKFINAVIAGFEAKN